MTKPAPNCPHCERPIGFEYSDVEPGKCQLWRWLHEEHGHGDINPRSFADCYAHTSRRIKELQARLDESERSRKAAQAALSRHHTNEQAKAEPFRDDARITG